MKKQKNAYDFKRESRIFALVMLIILLLIMAAGVMELCGVFHRPEKPEWQPTVIYPMANTNISWEQTFHPGGWSNGT